MWKPRRPALVIIVAIVVACCVLLGFAYRLLQHEPLFKGSYGSSGNNLDGWRPISGKWSRLANVISNAHYGRGDMLIAISPYQTDYRIAADLRFDLLFTETHYGDAGLVIRTTDPQPGVDSYHGYYAGIRPDDQTLVLGRASYEWLRLAEVHLNVPVVESEWYHLELAAHGCNLSVVAKPISRGQQTRIDYWDASCLTDGMAGLRSFYTQTSWRNVTIEPY